MSLKDVIESLEKEDFGLEFGKEFIINEIIVRNAKGKVVHIPLKEVEK